MALNELKSARTIAFNLNYIEPEDKELYTIFNTKNLVDKIKNIAPTAEAKQTLMILGNIIIKVENNKAYFTASDLEIQVSSSIDCEADDNTLNIDPAKKLGWEPQLDVFDYVKSQKELYHQTVEINEELHH